MFHEIPLGVDSCTENVIFAHYIAECLTSDGSFAALHQADNYLKSNYNLFLIIFLAAKAAQ